MIIEEVLSICGVCVNRKYFFEKHMEENQKITISLRKTNCQQCREKVRRAQQDDALEGQQRVQQFREKKPAHGQKEGADGYGTDDEEYFGLSM